MSEPQTDYVTEAMEMMGEGYNAPSIEIEQERTVIQRRAGKLEEISKPAFVKISTAFKQELPLISGDALKVWLFISLSINRKSGIANPGLRTIAAGVKLAVNTVQKCLAELEDLQLLEVDRDSARYNMYKSPDYVSANRAEPTVSNGDTHSETVSNSGETVSDSGNPLQKSTVSVILNQSNQINQKNSNFEVKEIPNNYPLDWYVTHGIQVPENWVDPSGDLQCNSFEAVFGFSSLPWGSTSDWTRFRKWIIERHNANGDIFRKYVEWRKGDGKYNAMSNTKIRQFPAMFIDTGYPTFLASVSMAAAQTPKVKIYNPADEPVKNYIPAPERKR